MTADFALSQVSTSLRRQASAFLRRIAAAFAERPRRKSGEPSPDRSEFLYRVALSVTRQDKRQEKKE